MSFNRRDQRVPVQCATLVSTREGGSYLGQLLDISPCGAGVSVGEKLMPRTRVSLLVDPTGPIPDLPSLPGLVQSVRRDGHGLDGKASYRLGISFTSVNSQAERRLRELARGAAGQSARPELSRTPEGCERLYQMARDHLAHGRFASAREVAIWAMRGEPRNPHYRALVFRANAEEALASGQNERARREM